MSLIQLNAVERRVLGTLLEKSLASPEYYPMTLNALVAGCNQKNNRDPVTNLDEDAVWSPHEQLRSHGLTSKVLPGGSSRVERYKHEVTAKWEWPKPQKAIMTELLLRGPQTVGELRTRAYRLCAFDNLESVTAVIDWLSTQTQPWVRELSRVPGQSAVRFAHTLYPADETAALSAAEARTTNSVSPASGAVSESASNALQSQVESLQTEVAELHDAIADLRRRLDRLEGR